MKFLNIKQTTKGRIVVTKNKVLLILKGKQKVEEAKRDITKILDFLFYHPSSLESCIGVRQYSIQVFGTEESPHSGIIKFSVEIKKLDSTGELALNLRVGGGLILRYDYQEKLSVDHEALFAENFTQITEVFDRWVSDVSADLPHLRSRENRAYIKAGKS